MLINQWPRNQPDIRVSMSGLRQNLEASHLDPKTWLPIWATTSQALWQRPAFEGFKDYGEPISVAEKKNVEMASVASCQQTPKKMELNVLVLQSNELVVDTEAFSRNEICIQPSFPRSIMVM